MAVFCSAWDGTESGNDRVYMARTPDFIDFYDRHTIIHNGQFVHVSNVNVQRLDPDSLELYATAWPDPQRQNKPIHFSSKLNGLEGPLQRMKISSRMNRMMGRTSEDRRSLWRVSIPFCQAGPAGGYGPGLEPFTAREAKCKPIRWLLAPQKERKL
jgi:hypothetical protein